MNLFKFIIPVVFMALYTNMAFADTDVVARVNGKPLTAFELNEEFQDLLPMMGSYHGGLSEEKIANIREKALNNLIEKELQYQYALEKGLSVSKKEIEAELAGMEKRFGSAAKFKDALKRSGMTKEQLKEFIKKRFLTAKAKKETVGSRAALSDSELKDYYEKNKESFKRPVELRASHILIGVDPTATKEEKGKKLKLAKDLLVKIRAGEDFAKLAMRYSTDDGSAPIGGDIGTFHKEMADQEFENAVLALKVGEVSDVVETIYGYHIIMLTGKKPETQLTFDDVNADIKKRLEKKRGDELYNTWMEGLRAKANIEIVKK
ncbi:MAG: peptidylprolyl isomerase [Deltaproteobacteria bacterium]|nr:peptidylprolyl isomerase [Deltaproteobacteria bacterium]